MTLIKLIFLIFINVAFLLSGCEDNQSPPSLPPQVVRGAVDMGSSSLGGVEAPLGAGEAPLGAVEAPVSGTETAGTDAQPSECSEERCDALDNDCDGSVDEGISCQCTEDSSCYSGPEETRGVGLCRDGTRACSANGEQWLACEGSVVPVMERCDEQDNDCDGRVDEETAQPCGECEVSGPELCDGLDNDCDGIIDEELVKACPCDKSETRTQTCSDGVWTGCIDSAGRELSSDVATIYLPALSPNCPFDSADNLSQDGGVFAARVEQSYSFELPPGTQLCGFSLSGSNEDFYYDDELMLLLNDVPLIGSVNFASQFEIEEGLPRYDWLRIRGKSTEEVGEEATCIAGATACQIPGTQSNGEINVAFDIITNTRLAGTSDNGTYEFKIVVTGDNDESLDCSHSGLTLQVSYDYLAD